jgi:hypothetical protein
MKVYGQGGSIALYILTLDTMWWLPSDAPPLNSAGKLPHTNLIRDGVGFTACVDDMQKKKNRLSLPTIEPRFLGCPPHNLVTV